MTFGEKLRELRRKAGMSQDALAERLEVSRQAVSKWELDEAMPETEKVVRIARLFDVSLDELLLERTEKEPVQMFCDSPYADMKRFMKRHGYKIGYLLVSLGILGSVASLLMWQIWPQIGMSMLPSGYDSGPVNPYEGKTYTIIVGGEERVITDIPEFMVENALKAQGGGTEDSISSVFENVLQTQSCLFLIGLLPGAVLIAAGVVIITKGKKLSGDKFEKQKGI